MSQTAVLQLDHVPFRLAPHNVPGLPESYDMDIAFTKNWKKCGTRILCIVGHVARGDLRVKKMLGDPVCHATYSNLLAYAEKYASQMTGMKIRDVGYAFVNFNDFKSYDLQANLYSTALRLFKRRIKKLIGQVKPDRIILFGDEVAEQLIKHKYDVRMYRGWTHEIQGIPTINTIDIDRAYSPPSESSDDLDDAAVEFANILGYAGRMVARIHGDSPLYHAKAKPKPYLVNTVRKFDRMMVKLNRAKAIATDTETTGLETFETKVLTCQFSVDTKRGYVVPIYHKDAPWTAEELYYIESKLREFFGQKMDYYNGPDTRYLIGQNIGYDLRIIRHWLRLRYVYWPLWDAQAGEYCFDPDTLVVTDVGRVRIDDLIDMENKPKVLSFNHATGEEEWKPIVAASKHVTQQRMYELEYGGGTIRVTEDHKVWSVTRGSYVAAKDLTLDDEILLSEPTHHES